MQETGNGWDERNAEGFGREEDHRSLGEFGMKNNIKNTLASDDGNIPRTFKIYCYGN